METLWHVSDLPVFPIKFESSSSITSIPTYSSQPETLKRPRSEDTYHSLEKRQRIEPYSRPLLIDDDEIGIIRANASAALIQQFGRTAPGRIDNEQGSFMTDPHLYMRVLSLPILESLVRIATNTSLSLQQKSDYIQVNPNPLYFRTGTIFRDHQNHNGTELGIGTSILDPKVSF